MYAAPSIPESLFPGAAAYRQMSCPDAVHESSRRYFPYSERHLQALWFDDSLRPKNLKTSRGEPVIVENPGRWNLEAGPDFRDAVLCIGRDRRRVAGDAEIHVFPADWKNHGHPDDPRYENVRFHVTWFDGPVDESRFAPGTVHLSLYNICPVDLESIDVSAYPYGESRASSEFPLSGKHPDEVLEVLENAGMERLRQKTKRMAWLIEQRGEQQALYEETAAAFGYKNNKAPFRRLAQNLPLRALALYGDQWETVYAVLLGVSGLLPKKPGAKWSAESKAYFRSLWDCWWREEHRWEEVSRMDRSDWNLSGLRPLNHPVRRLCALAQWAASGFFDDALGARSAVPQPSCFWSTHVGWSGTEKSAELVGEGRMQAIELNVMVPFRLAKGDAAGLERLPVEPMNSVIREAAYTLFGPDHSPKLYRTALARQGLIQLFNDFILTGRITELFDSQRG